MRCEINQDWQISSVLVVLDLFGLSVYIKSVQLIQQSQLRMLSAPWLTLPTEMKFAIMLNLAHADVNALSRVNSATYHACIPALFHTVRLRSYDAIRRFLCSVPISYRRHIRHLDLCTLECSPNLCLLDQATAVASLLTCCSRIEKLVLRMAGSMDTAILSAFPRISHLQELAISNCLPEEDAPLSERLVVHIAASLPNLHTLTLDRISRSTLHSPDIAYAYPPIPRVVNDTDVPPHPLLGDQLNLPSLLLLPSLKNLSIRETHLGDPQWEETGQRIACKLEHLDLGGSYHESDDRNGAALLRILKAAAGPSISRLSLSTPLPSTTRLSSPISSSSSVPSSPSSGSGSFPFPPIPSRNSHPSSSNNNTLSLGNLKILQTSPYFPIENLTETLAHFEGSPIHTIAVECFDIDAVDAARAVEDFLSVRVCRRGEESEKSEGAGLVRSPEELCCYYDRLKRVEVVVIVRDDDATATTAVGSVWRRKQEQMVFYGVRRLVGYCRDLGLLAVVKRRTSEGVEEEEEWDLDEEEGEECCWDVEAVIP